MFTLEIKQLPTLFLTWTNITSQRAQINNKQGLLPKSIRDKIEERNKLRQNDPNDRKLLNLNEELTKLIQEHKSNIWKQKIEENWDHKTNTHILWNTLNNLQNKKPKQDHNRIKQKFLLNIATSFNHQFTNPAKYTTQKEEKH